MTESQESTIEIDPSLPTSQYDAAPPGSQRYFQCGNAGQSFTIVARDREHAQEILLKSGTEFVDEDGDTVDYEHADLEWETISDERAAEIRVYDERRIGAPHPLNTFRPGDWFCSEW